MLYVVRRISIIPPSEAVFHRFKSYIYLDVLKGISDSLYLLEGNDLVSVPQWKIYVPKF